jgi:putative FmdB family regulatory protein
MPTYEYRCKDCSHEFEIFQSFSDDALTECPQCSGPLRKVFGNVGISFKGSGFYKNDHGSRAKSSSGGESKSDKSDSSSTTSESSSSSDSSSKSESSSSSASSAA